MHTKLANTIRLFLCGDVMTGRGIDQVLHHPSDPVLYEPACSDAREYVRLAERVNGPIPRPVNADYMWGDALEALQSPETDLRIANLETSVTSSDDSWSDKSIHYRMHPKNLGCLTAARIDCCTLANNHILDWGYRGLLETLVTLNAANIYHAGAGCDQASAMAPVICHAGHARVLIFSMAATSSGVPLEWMATENRPGVNLLEDLSQETAGQVARSMSSQKRPSDVIVASIHWGENWGYHIPTEEILFAHRLIDAGVDVIHGHSSHHVKAVEVYRNRLILYGCGDFLNDYEGITGHRSYRADLSLVYLADIDPEKGHLVNLQMLPMQCRQFRLCHATTADASWLCDLLNRLGEVFGTQFEMEADQSLALKPANSLAPKS
jgi:poly-gamma-glutamate synthesis protein (capsule biosynthesis protein)